MSNELTVTVHHWGFESGQPVPVPEWIHHIYPSGYSDPPARGWYCWAYPSDNRAFQQWMNANCPTSETQHRFNSGDPMYTVQIFNDDEATAFEQAWVKK